MDEKAGVGHRDAVCRGGVSFDLSRRSLALGNDDVDLCWSGSRPLDCCFHLRAAHRRSRNEPL